MKNAIITISRQYGSGGRKIAKRLAEELNIPFYDNEIISMAAEKSGIKDEMFKDAELQAGNNLLYLLSRLGPETQVYGMPFNEKVFSVQSQVIRDVAAKGPCVILGRCADYVLSDYQNCINIYTYASFQTRVARAVTDYGLEQIIADKEVRKVDKSREAYYNYHTGNKWGDPANYDLMINMSLIDAEAAVELIKKYLDLRCDNELRKPYNE
ncbi:cytidylate kinase-like family protein [Lachnospiraceae bacterium NSJ-143]|nr:cytidylate kinase-like family protein [Lachnospiraceae bacterium NSJ-143]